MSVGWQVTLIVLWVVVLMQTTLILVLFRQVGLVYLGRRDARARDGLPLRSLAPAWEAADLTGRVQASSLFGQRPLLLVFAEPGCAPCKEFLPELREFARQHESDLNTVVVGTDSDDQNREMAREYQLEVPVLTQSRRSISADYRVFASPFVYFIDEEGVIRDKGVVNFRVQLEEKLRALASRRLHEVVA